MDPTNIAIIILTTLLASEEEGHPGWTPEGEPFNPCPATMLALGLMQYGIVPDHVLVVAEALSDGHDGHPRFLEQVEDEDFGNGYRLTDRGREEAQTIRAEMAAHKALAEQDPELN